MANRFNRWASTQYVGMPVDYYQQSLMVNEQRTQESVDKIEGLINAYGSIQAISPDAQALYDETINDLTKRTEEIAKQNLSTPESQRAVAKLYKDPTIVDNLDKVYTDALLAADARAKLNEYLKTNPGVNAVDYVQAFNRLGLEKGDSSKFNPNRFKNMPALVDYYDVNKLIAEEATKLKANEVELKKIVGDKYKSLKESGVLEDRIRELARDRVLADPKAFSQFQRNIRYQNHLADPYDDQSGLRKNAMAYRSAVGQQQAQLQSQMDALVKGRTDAQLAKDDPATLKKVQQARSMMKGLQQYTEQDPTGQFRVADEDIVNQMGLDRFVESFDAYAWRTRKEEEEWTPMAIAEFNWRQRWRMQQHKDKIRQEILNPVMQHLTIPGTAEQVDQTPDKWGSYIGERIPQLGNVRVDKNGFMTPDAYGDDAFAGVRLYDDKSKYKGNKFFNRGDLKITNDPNEVPPGYKKIGITGGGGEGSSYGGDLKNVYAPEGLQGFDKIPKDKNALYQKGIDQLKEYVTKKGLGADYDFTNQADQRRALQDVIRFNQAFEKAYMTAHTFPAGNTDSFRERVAEMFGRVPVYDSNNKMLSPAEVKELNEAYKKEKPTINGQPTDFHTKQPMYSFQVGGQVYRVPMHKEMQNTLAVPNDMLNRSLMNETGVFEYGPNSDLFINKMGPGGRPINMVIAGGGQQQYQVKAKELYDSNVSNLMETGLSETQAKAFLKNNYLNIQEAINNDYKSGYSYTNPETGKTTTLKYAVGREQQGSRRPTFKYFTNQLTSSPDLGGYIYNEMQNMGSGNNPGMMMLGFDLKQAKERSAIFQSLGDGDEFGLEDY